MHNCKALRSRLIEQAMNETLSSEFVTDLEQCPTCREEFASLRGVLRVADLAMQSTLPEEGFWSGYHARLRQRLESTSGSGVPSRSALPRADTGLQNWLRRLVTASVPVPMPVAAVLVVLFGVSLLFAMNSRRSSSPEAIPGPPLVITRVVEVPVIQERTITRVVYRDRTLRGRSSPPEPARSSAVAARRNRTTAEAPINLAGFKPANEVKLTIIKGNSRDEK